MLFVDSQITNKNQIKKFYFKFKKTLSTKMRVRSRSYNKTNWINLKTFVILLFYFQNFWFNFLFVCVFFFCIQLFFKFQLTKQWWTYLFYSCVHYNSTISIRSFSLCFGCSLLFKQNIAFMFLIFFFILLIFVALFVLLKMIWGR